MAAPAQKEQQYSCVVKIVNEQTRANPIFFLSINSYLLMLMSLACIVDRPYSVGCKSFHFGNHPRLFSIYFKDKYKHL